MKSRVLLVFLLFGLLLKAQNANVLISYNTYMSQTGLTYLEVYYLLDPLSLELQTTGVGYEGSVEITLTFSQGEDIINYDKFGFPVRLGDTLEASPILQQSRLQLDTGKYVMEAWFKDKNTEGEPLHLRKEVHITFDFETPHFSIPLFLDNFEKTTEENEFSKNGYDLYPDISLGSLYLHDGYSSLSYYTELYNSDFFGEEEPILIKYYIKNENTSEILSQYSGFKRETTGKVVPILNSINIAKLPTGNYSLIIKAVNKNNEVFTSDSTFFYRYREFETYDYDQLASLDITSTFVEKLNDIDTLYRYIDCLYPISTPLETRYAENQKKNRDLKNMQRYFLSFWLKRNPNSPSEAWGDYWKTVQQIDKKYRTPIMPGYKTSRGRVFLQYGPPDLIESVMSDPRAYPYEIWQYNQLESPSTTYQINKIFVFVNFMLGSNDFELAHSDAVGEVYDPAWKIRIQQRDYRRTNVDDVNSPDIIDRSGSRYDNNIIIGK